MSSTDRMSTLDSIRSLTDRIGQTVILGNAVGTGTVSEMATIVSAYAGASVAAVPVSIPSSIVLNCVNGSFGIWAVFWGSTAIANFSAAGASIRSAAFTDIAAGLFSGVTNAGGLIGVQVFTATGGYTPTAGTLSVVVECVGGGGAGGGCALTAGNNSAGGGGGAGAIALSNRITSGFSGVTVTIGAGGTPGAAGQVNGGAGGATSFGALLIAGGGNGGVGDSAGGVARAAASGNGGAASGSASVAGFTGEIGGIGFATSTGASFGGFGGSTLYGAGGKQAIISGASQAGIAGTGKGSGGSGATGAGGAAQAGGAGTIGICIVYEYNT